MAADSDPKSVVIRYVEAVAAGDLPVIRDSFADDATWHYPGDLPPSGTWRGRDTIVDDFLGAAGALLRPETVVIRLAEVIAEGDRVVAEWTSDAVSVRGAEYHNRCIGVFTVRDGRIASVREYTDTRHAATVLFPDHQ
ncbi:nuclear transport factor 2 family protein [Streptantibioticus rubrisoli]|uniref:Nuclear transport factor 2 family protein n=1 Tax=Streptantibioticus rubrisoli TaxID=1387313 RepID=A0ABT1PAM6_9ACTN|nr:nuclear transport factor 2 family protein [Streptantibioticus rubrisoli]MCQ4041370.1 nuclear transport factor 2 family protein [Streptantibioticus rubrisoli]